MHIYPVEKPADYWHLFKHRLLKHQVWNRILAKRMRQLRDDQFLRLLDSGDSAERAIAEFHDKARFRFFFHPRNRKDFFLNLLTASQSSESISAEAQDVLDNKFQTLGSGTVDLGEPINWQKDFKSGKVWPLAPTNAIDLIDENNPSDVKVPWELSRFHQAWWLGKSYWITNNESCTEKFRSLLEDWIEKNPPGIGVNWANGMEVAIRACNWIAGYYFFCESRSISPSFWLRFLKSLYIHGVFIENNLEYSWRNHNHLLSDLVGLIFLGVFFRHLPFGKRWLGSGIQLLPEETSRQVYPDGVDYEKSTSYHRLVLELLYTSTILCEKNKIRFPDSFMKRLEAMFEFVQSYSRPDGSIPLIGDADDGRLFRFRVEDNLNDHRHALSVGAIVFGRRDFKQAAGKFHQDALWLFGGEGFEKHQMLGSEESANHSLGFPDGGFYIMRGENVHVLIDAGDLGREGVGGHGHNDTLSFEMWANGKPLIVDSGTYAYTSDVAARQQFRGTRAHSTVVIDGKEIAEFADLWQVKKDATNPIVLEWKTSDTVDRLQAEHYAYRSLPSPVIHRRTFKLTKNPIQLSVVDALNGSGKHSIEGFLHFAPDVETILMNSHTAVATVANERYIIESSAGTWSILETWFSPSYGVKKRNKTLRLFLETEFPIEIHVSIKDE